ncbi:MULTISPECIES: DUF6176 family protein [Lacticaseibacillus]|uniref:Uncharacterized protein n=1 Tax=Lacticaseibacillus casei DSM 20011 = JCM 1134 = ATCC 393 TaxID=1423732 RepID=A0AAD1AP26_LACCA|nr:DUF6176 family protein [Lacticaseibacillus casei]MBI6598179.1 hypothetical protein [Lacticaseibacillus casei]MBO1481841.1 hypothetical protein [Lacticaseibacillus casei]MBO2417121.1 hypothetical protein [Lacticaseibacillus casei]MCK2081509.1 hypothetical protein [Lacticaseibacillus casei]MDZ5496382.1 DUF6176 family protein [Lacticaseibacillus casei]
MIELEGFAVHPDKIARAQEWMAFLKSHQEAVNATLVPEHITVERIFSLTFNNRMYLCWYSEQTAPSPDVAESANPIDKVHVAFWRECIDESVPSLKFRLENEFVNPNLIGN